MADQASAVPFDEAPVTKRYWLSIILFAVTGVVDFFDFFVVGFLVSVLAPKWHLTFGQTSIMLMSAGIGAMLGALASGFLADRFGRKPLARRRRPDLRTEFRRDCADTGRRLDLLCDTCASSSALALRRAQRQPCRRSSNSRRPATGRWSPASW